MDRASYLPILFALIGVVAVSLGAATLDTAVGDDERPATAGSFSGGDDARNPVFEWRPPSTVYRVFIALYVVFLLVGGYVLYRRYGLELYAILLLGFVLTLLVVWLLDTPPTLQGYTAPEPSVAGPANDSGAGTGPSTPPGYLYLLVVTGILVAIGVLVRTTVGGREPTAGERTSETESASERTSAVGRVAGRTATRLESERDTEVSNEVYRAWREMIRHLSVPNPAASTPSTFAEAAVDAGMHPQDVDELTRLFEVARYSDEDVTDEQEDRAIAALRRIEDRYTGER